MLHDFTITEEGMNQVFIPKAEQRIRILVNKANNFATICVEGKKDQYDRLNTSKALEDEISRMYQRGKELLS